MPLVDRPHNICPKWFSDALSSMDLRELREFGSQRRQREHTSCEKADFPQNVYIKHHQLSNTNKA